MVRFEERMDFVEYWAEFVSLHTDAEWSSQQNMVINSMLGTAKQWSREEYLQMKKEKCFISKV